MPPKLARWRRQLATNPAVPGRIRWPHDGRHVVVCRASGRRWDPTTATAGTDGFDGGGCRRRSSMIASGVILRRRAGCDPWLAGGRGCLTDGLAGCGRGWPWQRLQRVVAGHGRGCLELAHGDGCCDKLVGTPFLLVVNDSSLALPWWWGRGLAGTCRWCVVVPRAVPGFFC